MLLGLKVKKVEWSERSCNYNDLEITSFRLTLSDGTVSPQFGNAPLDKSYDFGDKVIKTVKV